jgi:hypothetical protein
MISGMKRWSSISRYDAMEVAQFGKSPNQLHAERNTETF